MSIESTQVKFIQESALREFGGKATVNCSHSMWLHNGRKKEHDFCVTVFPDNCGLYGQGFRDGHGLIQERGRSWMVVWREVLKEGRRLRELAEKHREEVKEGREETKCQ